MENVVSQEERPKFVDSFTNDQAELIMFMV